MLKLNVYGDRHIYWYNYILLERLGSVMSFSVKGSGSFVSASSYHSTPVLMSKPEKTSNVENNKVTHQRKDADEAIKITKDSVSSDSNIVDLLWLIKHFSIKDMIHKKKRKDQNQTEMIVDVSVREELK